MNKALSYSLRLALENFIIQKMGIHFQGCREKDLDRGIKQFAENLDFNDIDACAQWLINSPMHPSQIAVLATYLTIGETYFFRDPKYFEILEKKIFPELVVLKNTTSRQLRIWSAGCSTGEEPYSIAISLNKMIPDIQTWNITLLATDINTQAIAQLNKGIYREWSFRGVSKEIKEKYFSKDDLNNYCILPKIKDLVSGGYLNLASDLYPTVDNNTNAMDLIFCRNVLMYFSPEQAQNVINKFYNCLVPGGYLMVSPCECNQSYFASFEAMHISGISFYRKPDPTEKKITSEMNHKHAYITANMPSLCYSSFKNNPIDTQKPAQKNNEQVLEDIYEQALGEYHHGFYAKVISLLEKSDPHEMYTLKTIELLIRTYANIGELEIARQLCIKAIHRAKVNVHLYYLHALILEEMGNLDEATVVFKQILYLDHDFILAHFNLGQISLHLGYLEEANKYFNNAKHLAGQYSSSEIIPESEGMTSCILIEAINLSQKQIKERAKT